MSVSEPFEWASEPLAGGPLPLTDAELGELLHHTIDLAQASCGTSGSGMTSTGTALDQSLTRYQLTNPRRGPVPDLLVIRNQEQATFVAVGTEGDVGAAQLWSDSLEKALPLVGKSYEDTVWTAVITAMAQAAGSRGPALANAAIVGPLELRPATDPYHEFRDYHSVPAQMGRLGGEFYHSWPVIVRGTARGYTWHGSADRDAVKALMRLCSLLTVASNMTWSVGEPPSPQSWIDRFGPDWRLPAGPAEQFLGDTPDTLERTEFEVEPWLQAAWQRVEDDARVDAAMLMFREGMTLIERHQSFALVAFISTIEAMAELNKKPARCAKCGLVTGSSARFRDAISLVLEPDQVALLSTAYTPRSSTVHSAQLHGDEPWDGVHVFPPVFGPDDRTTFRWTTLQLARAASARLLLRALGRPIAVEEQNRRRLANR